MDRHAIAAVWAISQATPDGATEGLHWWLLVGGIAGTVITLVLSSSLYWAFCRRGSRGLETGSFVTGLTGVLGLPVILWGASQIVANAPSGPRADTSAFLLLLAATVGIGAILVGAFVLVGTSVPPRQGLGPYPEPVAQDAIMLAVVADLVAAMLAMLGAAGVVHLNVVKTVAWACVGVGLGVIAVFVLCAIAWTLVAIANP